MGQGLTLYRLDNPIAEEVPDMAEARRLAREARESSGHRVVIVRAGDGRLVGGSGVHAPSTYSVQEVAELLAVHDQTVRRWCREGKMAAAQLGRGYRISALDLQDWYQERGGGRLMPERTTDERLDDLAQRIRDLPDDRRRLLEDELEGGG